MINWGNPMGTGDIPQLPLPAWVPSSSYGVGVPNSRGHQRPVSVVTACFGGIRHVWAKVLLPPWEVALSRKQGELRTAAVCVTVVVGKRQREADLPPVGCRERLAPGSRGCGSPWVLKSGSDMSESFLSGLTLHLIALHRAWEGKAGAGTKLSGGTVYQQPGCLTQ